MGVWLHLGDAPLLQAGDFLDHGREVVGLCSKKGVPVIAVLNNAVGSSFEAARVHRLLDDPLAQGRLIADLSSFLNKNNLHGLQVDFENLSAGDLQRLPSFLQSLAGPLHRQHKVLQTALEISTLERPVDWRRWSAAVDGIVLMDYDEHSSEDAPGPPASLQWSTDNLRRALTLIPAPKIILGLGNYGYDWGGRALLPPLR